jgi:hypothetical protein
MRHEKLLADLTEVELAILQKVVDLLGELPGDLGHYLRALAELRQKVLGIPGRSRGEVTRGVIDGHQIRVTEPWGA